MAEQFAEGVVTLRAEGLDQIEAAAKKAADAAKKTADEISGIESALKKQIAQFGLNSKEIAVWELRAKGATQAQINGIMNLTAKYERLQEKQKALADSAAKLNATKTAIAGVTDELKKQIATFGMSADKIQLWELKAKGATSSQLLEVRKLQQEYAKLQATAAGQVEVATKAVNPFASTGPMARLAAAPSAYDRLKGLAAGSSQITGMIGGLAAMGGIKLAADALSNLSKKALELKGAHERGEITAREFNDQMARAVPIAGSLYAAVADSTQAFQDYVAWAAKSAGASEKFASSLESAATRAAKAKSQFEAIRDLRNLSQGLRDAKVDMGGDEWDAKFDAARARKEEAIAQADAALQRGLNPEEERLNASKRLKASLDAGVDPELAHEQHRRDVDATIKTKPEHELRKARDVAVNLAQENYDQEESRIKQEMEMSQRAQLNAWGVKVDPNKSIADQFGDEQGRRNAIQREEIDRGATPGVTDEIRKRIEEMAKAVSGYSKEAFDAERQKFVENGASRGDLFRFDGGGDEWRKRSLGTGREAKGISAQLGAGAGDAVEGTSKAADVFGDVSKKVAKVQQDFNVALRVAQNQVDFRGMTPDQVEVEQFRRRGVPEDQLSKLIDLQAKQEKKTASTQMLSAMGVQDYIQQAIGNAPMQQKTLKAAEDTADAAKKQAACVKDNAMTVVIKSMPPVVATYG